MRRGCSCSSCIGKVVIFLAIVNIILLAVVIYFFAGDRLILLFRG